MQGNEKWMLKVVADTMEVGERKADYARRIDEERRDRLREKVLHWKFFREVEGVADGRS